MCSPQWIAQVIPHDFNISSLILHKYSNSKPDIKHSWSLELFFLIGHHLWSCGFLMRLPHHLHVFLVKSLLEVYNTSNGNNDVHLVGGSEHLFLSIYWESSSQLTFIFFREVQTSNQSSCQYLIRDTNWIPIPIMEFLPKNPMICNGNLGKFHDLTSRPNP